MILCNYVFKDHSKKNTTYSQQDIDKDYLTVDLLSEYGNINIEDSK